MLCWSRKVGMAQLEWAGGELVEVIAEPRYSSHELLRDRDYF